MNWVIKLIAYIFCIISPSFLVPEERTEEAKNIENYRGKQTL